MQFCDFLLQNIKKRSTLKEIIRHKSKTTEHVKEDRVGDVACKLMQEFKELAFRRHKLLNIVV